MIGDSTYIRQFTPLQRQQLEAIAAEQELGTAPAVIFFALEQYFEQKAEIARLYRIIEIKKKFT